jgi:hypothetical protein
MIGICLLVYSITSKPTGHLAFPRLSCILRNRSIKKSLLLLKTPLSITWRTKRPTVSFYEHSRRRSALVLPDPTTSKRRTATPALFRCHDGAHNQKKILNHRFCLGWVGLLPITVPLAHPARRDFHSIEHVWNVLNFRDFLL